MGAEVVNGRMSTVKMLEWIRHRQTVYTGQKGWPDDRSLTCQAKPCRPKDPRRNNSCRQHGPPEWQEQARPPRSVVVHLLAAEYLSSSVVLSTVGESWPSFIVSAMIVRTKLLIVSLGEGFFLDRNKVSESRLEKKALARDLTP